MALKNQAVKALHHHEGDAQFIEQFEQTDGTGVVVDQVKYQNLKTRMSVYGDIVQCETEESLYEALKKANNDVPKLIKYLNAKHKDDRIYQPPTVYKNNETPFKPPTFKAPKHNK